MSKLWKKADFFKGYKNKVNLFKQSNLTFFVVLF